MLGHIFPYRLECLLMLNLETCSLPCDLFVTDAVHPIPSIVYSMHVSVAILCLCRLLALFLCLILCVGVGVGKVHLVLGRGV